MSGITNANLIRIPICESGERANPYEFENPTILLDVDMGGETWYYADECRQSITWRNMWEVLPSVALGINFENLQKIPYGEVGM